MAQNQKVTMIVEGVSTYVLDRLFVYQLASTLITFSLINTVVFFLTRKRRYQLFKYYGIPGPEPRILDGSLHLYIATQTSYRLDEEFHKRYGKYHGVFIGDEPSLVISDVHLLKKIFLESMSSFTERSVVFMETPLSHSILLTKYSRWKTMRKIMSPAFSSFKMRGESSTRFIEDSIKLMLDYIEDKLQKEGGSTGGEKSASIDMHDLMKSTALHMISSMAIQLPNVQVKENEDNVRSLDSYLSSVDKGVVLLAVKFPFFKRILSFLSTHFEHNATMALVHRELNSNIDKTLNQMSKYGKSVQKDQTKLIDTLIRLHYEGKMTREEVLGNAEAVLFAGYDTTSTTLAYIFWVLGKFPDVQERLRQELMAHGIQSKYLEQVINETMRLYPTVLTFTTRLATKTVTIDNLTIPQGTRVVYNSWLLHRNPELWPEPEKFDPERFREGVEIHPCAFAPFGLGERKCLGYQLALMEIKMIVCDITMRYRLKTKAPELLELVTYATVLTKPKEKVMIELDKI